MYLCAVLTREVVHSIIQRWLLLLCVYYVSKLFSSREEILRRKFKRENITRDKEMITPCRKPKKMNEIRTAVGGNIAFL